ncbi:hypothetical protein AMTR_s00010p00151420 [Amborella trichopoda]|uniref:Uncharacterized protein n=1 Tax=Amborella trichopoda TaxID=13333 RepID=W1NF99_AMBTC|nr:hypothetical protein AMTR_s00010p00151420 [Amborella trichopoda]
MLPSSLLSTLSSQDDPSEHPLFTAEHPKAAFSLPELKTLLLVGTRRSTQHSTLLTSFTLGQKLPAATTSSPHLFSSLPFQSCNQQPPLTVLQ